MTRSRALWLMVAALLVAAVLRLPELRVAPPGLHYDEAANAILAADIGLRGERPIFISSYTGKEVLFFYVAGALTNAIGSSLFALRLSSALIGLLTIAASYWLGRELLADRRVAVIAAALIAVSFWHLMFSRLGFRAISQPLLQALAVAALFRGLKVDGGLARAWQWFVLSGVFLGLTAYTYLAARLFPVPLLLALLPLLTPGVRRWERRSSLILVAAVALLVIAPLLAYFIQNPETFWVRIAQVAPAGSGGNPEASTLDSYLRSLGMFFLAGDPYWRFNLPSRPLFNWFWGGLLLAGWIAAILRWRRWWYDWQKAAVLLLVSVPLLMILPTALATSEIIPSNLRAIGLIPFIFYLPALGLVTLVEQLADVVRRPGVQLTAFLRSLSFLEGYEVNYAFLVMLILLTGGAATWTSYFDVWAARSDVYYDSDADLVAVATFIDEEAPPDVPIFIAALHYRHPTLAFLSENYERVKWLVESQALVLPPDGPALYVFPHNSPAPEWALNYLESAERITGPEGPDGEPLYVAYRLSEAPEIEESTVQGTVGDMLKPLWIRSEGGASGETVPVTFAWRVLNTGATPLRLFAHLTDIWGHRWGQTERLSYAVEQWQPGEIVIQRVEVPVSAGAPPGAYRLHLGFFEDASGQRVPRLDEEGRYAGDAIAVDDVRIAAGSPPQTPPQAPSGKPQLVRSGLQLLGYTLSDGAVGAGASLPLSLWWWATAAQPPMTVRLELLRGDNTGVVLIDTTPVRGTYPFQNWQTPLFLRDEINPRIPATLAAGDYRLHLRLLDADSNTVFTSSLGAVSVEPTERTFEAPQLQYPLDATFAGEVELLGYRLEQISPQQFRLQLAWRALQEIENNYTVFVHLLNPDGTCCLWQSDRMPRQGQYPTSRWVEGEVVVEEYLIESGEGAAAGAYPLEVGLYVAETGRRLLVEMPGREVSDFVLLRAVGLGD